MNSANQKLAAHLATGIKGEDLAQKFLLKLGYTILAKNWRHSHLELDLICRHSDQIVFVEVKTRNSSKCGGPLAGVTKAKQTRLIRAACFWLSQHNCWNMPCSFDIISVIIHSDSFSLEHIPNAFEAGNFMDCSNTAWQF